MLAETSVPNAFNGNSEAPSLPSLQGYLVVHFLSGIEMRSFDHQNLQSGDHPYHSFGSSFTTA